jgi:uncharacterized phage-associated protein
MPRLLPEPAVPVTFDVALWFLDRARAADGHLPAQKLQDLLYLACSRYEREQGRPLTSAAFVANEVTAADPNLYRLLEEGRPKIRAEPLPSAIEGFLAEIWMRYGHATIEHLNVIVRRILETGSAGSAEGAEGVEAPDSPLLARRHAVLAVQDESRPDSTGSLRPTHRGRRVTVAPWRPPSAPKRPG